MQALAEGAAAAQTKTAVATDATVMLSSCRAAAGTLGPPAFAQSPAQQVLLPGWGPSVPNPLLSCWHREEGRAGRLRASPATPAGQPHVAAGTLQATAGLQQHC